MDQAPTEVYATLLDAGKYLCSVRTMYRILEEHAELREWRTIEKIAGFNALDTWILFPVSAIARMLPRSKQPDDISVQWVKRLELVFGDESWRALYRDSFQLRLFGDADQERAPGVEGLLEVYKDKLGGLFGDRFLTQSRTLKNSNNSPLFEFLFCGGNPKGSKLAKTIAKHILEHLGDVLRSLSKKKMYGSPNSNPSPELGADKENHTSWERYYQVSDCSSSLRNDWYSGI